VSLLVVQVVGSYSTTSDSYSMRMEVSHVDYMTDETTTTCLARKYLELLTLDGTDPCAQLRGLLEEGLSPWRFRIRCTDPF
jgi:hypothetical protein